MAMRLIVDAAEAAAAQANMIQAIQAYQEATEAVKNAGDQLASQWKGDAQVAFVENQANCYNFYVGIREIALGAAEAVKKMIEEYNELMAHHKSIVGRG